MVLLYSLAAINTDKSDPIHIRLSHKLSCRYIHIISIQGTCYKFYDSGGGGGGGGWQSRSRTVT